LAEPFEASREALDAAAAKSGTRPQIFVATLGALSDFTLRAGFTRNLFEAGGFAAPVGDGFSDIAAMVDAFRASGASIACLASSDERYAQDAESAARAVKGAGCVKLWLAGRPGETEAALRAAGVDEFVYAGVDVIATLTTARATLGL
jgi:methylmalonyl-CoA mutase